MITQQTPPVLPYEPQDAFNELPKSVFLCPQNETTDS